MKMTRFVYVIYIRTTPKKLWRALTDSELVRRYFYGAIHESEWNAGAPWGLKVPDGRVADSGDVLEVKP
ncbi:MAG TPA: SRPBCC domain-containing protein, partial [Verrucomicrobiae bacterium]|nr:SRPBCC domain-containing protein [Verrucomicrobiae bacterium]